MSTWCGRRSPLRRSSDRSFMVSWRLPSGQRHSGIRLTVVARHNPPSATTEGGKTSEGKDNKNEKYPYCIDGECHVAHGGTGSRGCRHHPAAEVGGAVAVRWLLRG